MGTLIKNGVVYGGSDVTKEYVDEQNALQNAEIEKKPNDIQINGTSIVQDGVANIPIAKTNELGLVLAGNGNYGIMSNASGTLFIMPTTNDIINGRRPREDYSTDKDNRLPITPTHIDYAVKAAMCDGKGAAWSEDEKASARERMGTDFTKFTEIVTTEEINYIFITGFDATQVYFNIDFPKVAESYKLGITTIEVYDSTSLSHSLAGRLYITDGNSDIYSQYSGQYLYISALFDMSLGFTDIIHYDATFRGVYHASQGKVGKYIHSNASSGKFKSFLLTASNLIPIGTKVTIYVR